MRCALESWFLAASLAVTKIMTCIGQCYSVTLTERLEADNEEAALLTSYHEPLDAHVYSPLKSAQTRILRLHPSGKHSNGDTRNEQLHADLVIVNLHILEGVLIDGTDQNISYQALSYSWGRPKLSDVLVCNGKAMLISNQNAAALRALRHHSEIRNLWIDALCINQEDKNEKSKQVAQMLAIYRKAQMVQVWLGQSDRDSMIAFAYARKLPALEDNLSKHRQIEHMPTCTDHLRDLLLTLICLFGKPWLGRTWIRQEVYAARQLVVRCGSDEMSWQDFTRLAKLSSTVSSLLSDHNIVPRDYEMRIRELLEEAQRNACMPLSGVKQPRDLVDMLSKSRQFSFTDPRDTFYAILGMCNVNASTDSLTINHNDQRNAVSVDYQKSLQEVYTDASRYIIARRDTVHNLLELWHRYQRSPLHAEGLATWAVDWLSGLRNGSEHEDFEHPTEPFAQVLSTDVERPHSRLKGIRPSFIPLYSSEREWHWPEPLQETRTVLRFRVRVINYVAHLTDFTCDLGDFLDPPHDDASFALGPAALSIHTPASQSLPLFCKIARQPTKFDSRVHEWRLAILGIANTEQLCLVPSSTSRGDLIVAVAPGLLPMVIRPSQGNGTADGLFPDHESYETGPCRVFDLSITSRLLLKLWMCTLMAWSCLPIAFGCFYGAFENVRRYALMCYGGTLAIILIMDAICTYIYVCAGYLTWHRGPFLLAPMWETVVVPCLSIVSYTLLCITNDLARLERLSVGIFCFATLATAFGCGLYRQYYLVDHGITIALRREVVHAHLDDAAQKIGQDHEFHGPLFVRSIRYCWPFDVSWLQLNLWWLLLKLAIAVRWPKKSQTNLEKSRHQWLFDQIFCERKLSAWERPIQEFRLH